jgi:hypothetical protein
MMEAFGHATQQQTLAYLGIQADEIAKIYDMELSLQFERLIKNFKF